MKVDPKLLDAVFGPGPGDTAEARAETSRQQFVRGLDLLTFDSSTLAKGHRLTASEALDAYGFDVLAEVASDGSAIISETVEAAGRALRERRERLGLNQRSVARRTGLPLDVVAAIEASKRRPIREYEKVACVLGLDERALSFKADPATNERLAVRLRMLREEGTGLSSETVGTLAEAAWVTSVQARLSKRIGIKPKTRKFEPLNFYGSSDMPAYRVGYDLADRVRESLGLGDMPIASLRDLVEKKLGITVLHGPLAQDIAGATVEAGDGNRAIVLNTAGRNANVYVLRSTLAHELCHILFDPPHELRELRVDGYADLERRPDQVTDRVEARANAFAVQLLAPQRAVVRAYDEATGDRLANVMDSFGISFTSSRYQIWNAKNRTIELDSLNTGKAIPEPDWEARERYTTTWHPIRELLDQPLRAGLFSAIVVRAVEVRAISSDTAASYLGTTDASVVEATPGLRDLYPDIFK